MNLYSYCLRFDNGAAPNPYWGICTLAICKPGIRRIARVGDWVVGLGSKDSPIGDISTRMVYAMKVTRVLSMKDYDEFCRRSRTEKLPDLANPDFRRKVGDCIYDFDKAYQPSLRQSIHSQENRETDLAGKNVLLSEDFYYFGEKAVELPEALFPLIHSTQGYKSLANAPYIDNFVQWVEDEAWKKNEPLGEPQRKRGILSRAEEEYRTSCSKQDRKEDEWDRVAIMPSSLS
jgi:Nucleotide modification associated domain 2